MENKYYTPSIEEFYVGFECEIKNSSDPIKFEWEHFKIAGVDNAEISGNIMDWNFYDTRTAINEKTIRVKYLDKEDIKSLGWKFSSLSKDRAAINWIENSTHEQNAIWLILGNKIQIINCREKYHKVLYLGNIKNKSELKKLMQQLGINANT